MHVVATAGHVDHGKSTLVRALTGMEPDRWAEERARGMTIDLGFAWTTLPSGRTVAFVDVPGHERFITNMLAGVGAAPAVMLVVAADEGWMPQTEEHVRAVAALGITRVLLAVTKADVTAPAPAREQALARLDALGITGVATVAASGVTGAGIDDVRVALDQLVGALPAPDVDAPVRLWVDRAFTVRGAGTVVTGTLPAGRLRVGDTLTLVPGGRRVEVRGLQSMQQRHDVVEAVARVAVNLRGVGRDDVARGMALVSDGAWTTTAAVDVACDHEDLPQQVVVHAGSAAVPARLRPLGVRAGRLHLSRPLPLHVGDRLLLRDPGARHLTGADVADVAPPPIVRRGDAARIGAALQVPRVARELVDRRGICRVDEVVAAGLAPDGLRRIGDWCVSNARWDAARARLTQLVAADPDPLSSGVPVARLAHQLDLPAPELVVALAADTVGVVHADGRVRPSDRQPVEIPGLDDLLDRLRRDPLAAPDATELAARGLGPAQLAHAVRASLLLRLADGVYVAPDAPEHTLAVLATLPETFTVSEARERLGSSRRVVVPLLEHLDATRRTRRLPDGKRVLVQRGA